MTTTDLQLLPGISEHEVRRALGKAGGNEIESGKFCSEESSAALAVNCFGWFLQRPGDLPPFPSLPDLDWPPCRVDIERQLRFPWRGGRHPWLDAVVETEGCLIGVESKRFEPFRDTKSAKLSDAYDRDVWGDHMAAYGEMRDRLRREPKAFRFLDATQLVKHAYGLVTQGRRMNKSPILLYLFAEPEQRGSRPIPHDDHVAHRREIEVFASAVDGAAVRFAACSYREWLSTWTGGTVDHANALLRAFRP